MTSTQGFLATVVQYAYEWRYYLVITEFLLVVAADIPYVGGNRSPNSLLNILPKQIKWMIQLFILLSVPIAAYFGLMAPPVFSLLLQVILVVFFLFMVIF